MRKDITLLGGLSVKEFLRDYWQKKPLLIRQAMPGFRGLLDSSELFDLACDPDAQARLIEHKRGKWHLQHGPFAPSQFADMGKSKWTVLVQGINHYLPEAADLLQHFNFIPHSRLDDLMVSYAPRHGGVGPHFDSYDVFLLQGMGHRRWQISSQKDKALIPDAPLRILQNFTVEHEWVLEPGDMLYLPPHWAHNGIAEDDCMTYSIGFRTPSYHELTEQFLIHLQDNICIDGMYADPDLKLQKHPSEVSEDMLKQVAQVIDRIKWNNTDVASFLGKYLSEPKPHIFFEPPEKPVTFRKFGAILQKSGIRLNLKTLMLCHGKQVFINGEIFNVTSTQYPLLRDLADSRKLPANEKFDEKFTEVLYQWYLEGYIDI